MTITPLRNEPVVAGWPDSVLASPGATPHSVTLVTECGHSMVVDVARWHSPASDADISVIERCHGPVLDVGSGPGRIVRALGAQGIPGLGIDLSRAAVEHAFAAGAACVVADVFDTVPGEGTWKTALLLDGNIGIGGDPVRLLRRLAELVTTCGTLVVEVERHRGVSAARRVQVAHGTTLSAWFDWAVVSLDELPAHATESGWTVAEMWSRGERWFMRLVRSGSSS